jgi:toxin ParE1/3/4
MNSYRFSPLAVKDLTAVCDFIAVENPRAASQLFDSIRKKCRLVAQFPNSGKRYERLMKGLRGVVVGDYIVFYLPQEDGIEVLRVVSGCRDLEALFVGE